MKIQSIHTIRASCNLPIDAAKAKRELEKRLARGRTKNVLPESGQMKLPDCADPRALGEFLFAS